MLRVEFFKHGRNAPSGDGLGAARAKRAPLGVVVGLAVGQTLVVEE